MPGIRELQKQSKEIEIRKQQLPMSLAPEYKTMTVIALEAKKKSGKLLFSRFSGTG